MSSSFEQLRSFRVSQLRSADGLLKELLHWNPDVQSAVLVGAGGKAIASASAGPSVIAAAELTAATVTPFFEASERLGLTGIRLTTIEGDDGSALVARIDSAAVLVIVANPEAVASALRGDVEWIASRLSHGMRPSDAQP
jgi:predicted regulator of Ras-like GTPase activity (Roadblock/LC7/MglB family)